MPSLMNQSLTRCALCIGALSCWKIGSTPMVWRTRSRTGVDMFVHRRHHNRHKGTRIIAPKASPDNTLCPWTLLVGLNAVFVPLFVRSSEDPICSRILALLHRALIASYHLFKSSSVQSACLRAQARRSLAASAVRRGCLAALHFLMPCLRRNLLTVLTDTVGTLIAQFAKWTSSVAVRLVK
ncbi:hypothetical protein FN846DRAFT_662380 [Sphaerosporella brunnea]|uniref:Uncharacterized protein n=1 Tax=Sphaerosporella brunnea TaxID=1250544 RepID=A0A5J5EZ76_9PEZI|nr:hypothetical protein FN846DRAFT_662380 [Sphaerosporella brunnea]